MEVHWLIRRMFRTSSFTFHQSRPALAGIASLPGGGLNGQALLCPDRSRDASALHKVVQACSPKTRGPGIRRNRPIP